MVVGDVPTAVDLLVLGAGPAGYAAALRAAQLGRQVTLVDPGPPGGTCLNAGCIPLKALLSATERYQLARPDALAAMGIHVESLSCDWSQMQAWKQGIVERLTEGVQRLLAAGKITCMKGTGWFINAQELRVEGEHSAHRFKFTHCILAVGASHLPAETPPATDQQLFTPTQALALRELPVKLGIFGEDYIALELATLFARVGVQVTLYLPGAQLLPKVDPAALRLVQQGLRKLGIHIVPQATLANCSERPLVISNAPRPRTASLHLSDAGVQLNAQGGVAVNTMLQSSVPHILAVGDCVGGPYLASHALRQGKLAAEVACGQRVQFAPLVTPMVVHTTPELAMVGYSASEASTIGQQIITGRFPLAANGRALTLAAEQGVALIVARAQDEAILGATLVGPRAGDLLGQVTLAIEMGATLTDITAILYAHPGLGEGLLESAEQALGRALHVLAYS